MKQFLITAGVILGFVAVLGIVLEIDRASRYSDSVILVDTACQPPCWGGITPGESTADDVYHVLADARGVSIGSIDERRGGGDTIIRTHWYFTAPAPDSSGVAFFRENVTTALRIYTVRTLRLRDVLEKLGEPDSLWQHCAHSSWISFQQMVLIWREAGYLVQVDFNAACDPLPLDRLTPRSRLSAVVYFNPEDLDYLLERRILFLEHRETILDEIQPWPGAPWDA
jgi:hypothetical protein